MLLTDLISGIIILGLLVFVHELGHFLVAKAANVKVLKFSLGFGRSLISRKWGETEYMISAIPLGGYVKMQGESEAITGQVDPDEEEEEDASRSYAAKSPLVRIAIIAAGPLMNLLLPLLILPISYMAGANIPAYLESKACIGVVVEDSPAAVIGFQAGDCIASLSGVPIESWNATNMQLIENAGTESVFEVIRGGENVFLTLPSEINALEGLQSIGLSPLIAAKVGMLSAGMPAKAAGLKKGDAIISVGGTPLSYWHELKPLVQSSAGEEVEVVVRRGEKELSFQLTPVKVKGNDDFLIGIGPQYDVIEKEYSLGEAVAAGFDRTVELIDLTLVFLQKLVTGKVSMSNVGGPIMIVEVAGQAAQVGFSAMLSLMAFLSIQLGILNLLPIPILDGGHLLFNFYEVVFRRPMSLRTREFAQQVGLVLLILLMIIVFYNDITRKFIE